MDYTHYLFAGFVFLLVCAVLLLNSKLKQNKSETEKPPVRPAYDDTAEQLMLQYRRLENAMRNLEDDLQDTREELNRKNKEGEEMLSGMERLYNDMHSELSLRREEKGKGSEESRILLAAQKKKPGPKKKTTGDRVRELHRAGLSADSIAQELRVSRGEVDLVLGLNKKR